MWELTLKKYTHTPQQLKRCCCFVLHHKSEPEYFCLSSRKPGFIQPDSLPLGETRSALQQPQLSCLLPYRKKGLGEKKYAFNTLLFNWDSHETLNAFSKMLKSYQAVWAKSSNQLPCSAPVEPLLSGLHFLLLHCKCATACSHSTSIKCRCK